ncbi:MAG: LysR family transcriptional regulator [Peptococcaceae bacterium]|nr:LysR family transcriptional regulator [Peptococcaceae bacterium]
MAGNFGFRPCCKIWLEKENIAFGEGLYNLLVSIDRAGSIAGAAVAMGMSYRAAWGKIREAEEKWKIKLVDTRVGGEAGGGTRLTGEARALLTMFRELKDGTDQLIMRLYEQL